AWNSFVSAAIGKRGVWANDIAAVPSAIDSGGQLSTCIAEFVAVLFEVHVHTVSWRNGTGRGAVIKVLLMQELTQCSLAIRSAMTVAVQYEQIAFCEIDCGKRAWKSGPPQCDSLGIARAKFAPFNQWLFVIAAWKNCKASCG